MRYTTFLPIVAKSTPPPLPKRGLAGLVELGIWETVIARAAWYHNWNLVPYSTRVPHVPFLWGKSWGPYADNLQAAVNILSRDYAGPLLWLNEPNDAAQANMAYDEAAQFYIDTRAALPHAQLIGPNMAIVGATKWAQDASWLRLFVARVNALTGHYPQFAAMTVHNYTGNIAEHKQLHHDWQNLLGSLGYADHPLWVSEWGVDNRRADAEEVTADLAQFYDEHSAKHAYYINAGSDDSFAVPVSLQQQPTWDSLSATGRGWIR